VVHQTNKKYERKTYTKEGGKEGPNGREVQERGGKANKIRKNKIKECGEG
jgi:hypothetical protein